MTDSARDQLLNVAVARASAGGISDLSLRQIAVELATSHRMLIYHFGTRDELLREILGQARQRHLEVFTDLLRVRPDEPYPTTLGNACSAMTGPHGQPYLRMFGRLHDAAGEPHWPGFRRAATTDWLASLEDGMRTLGRPELATVVLAVIRGLLQDLDATGDTARTDRAFQDFLRAIEQS